MVSDGHPVALLTALAEARALTGLGRNRVYQILRQRLEAFMTVMEAEASEEERYQRLLALLEGIRSVLGATNDAEDPRVHEALKRLRRSLTAYVAETYVAETEEG
jgi:hypothetical protein